MNKKHPSFRSPAW